MELVPVESSNIAAIGYNTECRLMRVLYRDGSMFDHPDVDSVEHDGVMRSQSKGQAVHMLGKHKPGTRIGRPLKLREPAKPIPPELYDLKEGEIPKRRVVQTHEPDPCCSAGLTRALPSLIDAERWECSKCGGDWRVHLVNGVRHWARVELIEVI